MQNANKAKQFWLQVHSMQINKHRTPQNTQWTVGFIRLDDRNHSDMAALHYTRSRQWHPNIKRSIIMNIGFRSKRKFYSMLSASTSTFAMFARDTHRERSKERERIFINLLCVQLMCTVHLSKCGGVNGFTASLAGYNKFGCGVESWRCQRCAGAFNQLPKIYRDPKLCVVCSLLCCLAVVPTGSTYTVCVLWLSEIEMCAWKR